MCTPPSSVLQVAERLSMVVSLLWCTVKNWLLRPQELLCPDFWWIRPFRIVDTFVDHASTFLGFTSRDNTSYEDSTIERLPQVIRTWERLLFLSDGKLNRICQNVTSGAMWWCFNESGKTGDRLFYGKSPRMIRQLRLLTEARGIRLLPSKGPNSITYTYDWNTSRAYDAMGDFSDHLHHVLNKKADDYARRLTLPYLTEANVAIFQHRSRIYIVSMQ